MASFWVGRKIRAAEGLRSVSYTHLDVYKRQGEVFTVTVPTSEQHDPYVVGLKRRYAAIVGSATAVFTVVGLSLIHIFEEEGDGAASVSEETIVRPRYEDKMALRCDLIGRKYALSQREIEVMLLFARGNTISSIAGELFISDNTVKTHMRRLYAKLGIHKKQELFALINSYVE